MQGTRQIHGILYAKARVPRLSLWQNTLRSAVFSDDFQGTRHI